MKRILLILIATTCLSCQSEIKPFEDNQYSIELKMIEIAGEKFISINDSKCNRRKYRVWKDKVGALENFQLVSMEECLMLIGFKPKAYADEWALKEYVRQEINEQGFEFKERQLGAPHESIGTVKD
jgi:hypothetical protein